MVIIFTSLSTPRKHQYWRKKVVSSDTYHNFRASKFVFFIILNNTTCLCGILSVAYKHATDP